MKRSNSTTRTKQTPEGCVKFPYLETILKVVVFFKKHGIVNDDLRCGDPEINDAIIHCLCGLTKATATLTHKTART